MKRCLIFTVLAILIAGAAFAQNNVTGENRINNWISAEVSVIGGGLRYERMLSDKLSIGGNVYYSSFIFIWNEMEVGGSVRLYPFSSGLYIGTGLGFHWHSSLGSSSNKGGNWNSVTGVAVSPDVGWKIDLGKRGGFFLQPGVKVPITIGIKDEAITEKVAKKGFGIGIGVVPYIGGGIAF